MVAIIDYKAGNPASIQNILKRASNIETCITQSPEIISTARAVILPGVGRFDYGMQQLHQLSLVEALTHAVMKNKVPCLGICLGAQLFFNKSEEGNPTPGLGWIDGEVVNFRKEQFDHSNLKVPHMGWTDVIPNDDPLFKGLTNPRFYFVHSYHFQCHNQEDVIATSHYGYAFPCVVRKNNIIGVQFHPEKSHRFGAQLFSNFLNLL
jgi:glutamine amidotransferase